MSHAGSDDSMAVEGSSGGGGALAAAAAADDAAMDAGLASPRAAARGSPGGVGKPPVELEREVKFEAQLYKMRDGEYALDFQVRLYETGRNEQAIEWLKE